MGSRINSPESDYGVLLTADGGTLFYTSRRANSTGGKVNKATNEYFEDVYVSTRGDQGWSDPAPLPEPVNTAINDASVGLFNDGRTMLIYRDVKGTGDLFETKRTGKAWSDPRPLGPNVNTRYHESSARYSFDRQWLYFVSDRPEEGLGAQDIYRSKWDAATKEWGPAENLGPTINNKPKRRTKAQITREAGLEPLADLLLADPTQAPEHAALAFVDLDKGVADVAGALEGARSILSERFSEDPALVGELREWLFEHGGIHARLVPGKENEGAKFPDYFDFVDSLVQIPSHRTLALFRARCEGIHDLDLEPVPVKRNDARGGSDEAEAIEHGHQRAESRIAQRAGVADRGRAADAWLDETCRQTWRYKLHVRLTLDLFGRIRERAEEEAIRIFGDNLKDLLLAPPAGPKAVNQPRILRQ